MPTPLSLRAARSSVGFTLFRRIVLVGPGRRTAKSPRSEQEAVLQTELCWNAPSWPFCRRATLTAQAGRAAIVENISIETQRIGQFVSAIREHASASIYPLFASLIDRGRKHHSVGVDRATRRRFPRRRSGDRRAPMTFRSVTQAPACRDRGFRGRIECPGGCAIADLFPTEVDFGTRAGGFAILQ